MRDENEKKQDNVVLYPGVIKRLVEKGMEELKKKEAEKALELFAQAEAYDASHAQARFGVVLSLIELGQQEEAVERTSLLLKEGIGDYYETLQVHVSLLVQLSRYSEVVTMLEAVLSEDRLPSDHAESLYELLHFSRQMSDTAGYNPMYLDEENKEETAHELKAGLHSVNEAAKWQALQTIRELGLTELTKDVRELASDETAHVLMRTFALQLLGTWDDLEELEIAKNSRVMKVQPARLESPGERQIDSDVRETLEDSLEHKNPVLLEMAKQLHHTYILAIYPFLPEPPIAAAWAGAFHLVASEQLGLETDEEGMARHYGCQRYEVLAASSEIEALEEDILLETQEGNQWFHT